MNDFDFLKQFAQNLDREELHEPTESDWEKLAGALSAHERGKRRRRLILAWAFPMAASTLFIILGSMLMQSRFRVDRMQTEIVRLQTEISMGKNISLTDTFVQHLSVVHYDTIYRTVLLQNFITQASDLIYHPANSIGGMNPIGQNMQNRDVTLNQQQKTENNPLVQNITRAIDTGTTFTAIDRYISIPQANTVQSAAMVKNGESNAQDRYAGQADSIKNQIGVNDSGSEGSIKWMNSLPALSNKSIVLPKSQLTKRLPDGFEMTVGLPAPAPPRVPMIRRLKPHNLMAGVNAGMLFPQTQDAEPSNSYIYGVDGQMAFGRNIRMIAGFNYGWSNFKVGSSALDNSGIPPLTPPTPNDILDFVLVKQPLRDFSIGINYVLFPDKRLRPYISVSWVAEQTLEQTLKYEFKNQMTEEETYVLVPSNNNTHFNLNGLKTGAGLEWAFAKQFSLGLEGFYQLQNASALPLLSERWGLRTGLAYSF
jgi:hypothetical protein